MALTFLSKSLRLTWRFVNVAVRQGPIQAIKKTAGEFWQKYTLRRLTFESLPWQNTTNRPFGNPNEFQILIIGHEASRTGAPIILLELARELARRGKCEVRIVLDRSGELTTDFARVGPTLTMDDLEKRGIPRESGPELIARLFRNSMRHGVAICNTVAVSSYFRPLCLHNVPVMAWIHELPTSIDRFFGGRSVMDGIQEASRCILTPSKLVRQSLIKNYNVDPERIEAIHYGVAKQANLSQREEARSDLRRELNLSPSTRIVLGCGTVDLRKGTDLFVQVAQQVQLSGLLDVCFVWVGKVQNKEVSAWLNHDIRVKGLTDTVRFVGATDNPERYFQASDLFLLTSREDPFPLVNMEALSHGVPVIAFQGGSGSVEVLEGAGAVVPYVDVTAMSNATQEFLQNPEKLKNASLRARQVSEGTLNWNDFSDRFCEILSRNYGYIEDKTELSVSAIVPNYNHSPYLKERLRSIFQQTRLPKEIIVLDDASTDDSVSVLNRLSGESPVPLKLIVNQTNSGSPFHQWLKGIQIASADLIWIAESDDTCKPDFLEQVVPCFSDEEVNLAYSQSASIDAQGKMLQPDYHGTTDDISKNRWRSWYKATAEEEVELALISRNTIPNASAVVFRRSVPLDLSDQLTNFRFAGDWFFYGMAIRGGKIAFVPESLNCHRHHSESVTKRVVKADEHAKETLAVKAFLAETFEISANAIARGVALSAWEHFYLGQQFGLERPNMTTRRDLCSTLTRLQNAYESRMPSRNCEELKILLVFPDRQHPGSQSFWELANSLAKKHRVLVANAEPTDLEKQALKDLAPTLQFLEGTLGETHWSRAGLDHRTAVIRELCRFHEIDVVHSHDWPAHKLVHDVCRDLEIPWFLHMYCEGDDPPVRESMNAPSLSLERESLIRASTGVFYQSRESLKFVSSQEEYSDRNRALITTDRKDCTLSDQVSEYCQAVFMESSSSAEKWSQNSEGCRTNRLSA